MPATTPPEMTHMRSLRAALDLLKRYGQGSSRGDLMPIDDAVRSVIARGDTEMRYRVEAQLAEVLAEPSLPAAARQYICERLVQVGSGRSVGILARQLNDPVAATSARTALEVMPDETASAVLRDAVPGLQGVLRAGVLTSLGTRRDARSLRLLTREARSTDPVVRLAAVAAIGELGTARAAKVLRATWERVAEADRRAVRDAALVCAEHLEAEGSLEKGTQLRQMVRQAE